MDICILHFVVVLLVCRVLGGVERHPHRMDNPTININVTKNQALHKINQN
ncbi:MAG: hypothetical protein IAX22_07270 [Candidatus Bathyarchaeota archaeon]|nr:hypothetical protein [Candidatus Bathyarchaeota archaeon]